MAITLKDDEIIQCPKCNDRGWINESEKEACRMDHHRNGVIGSGSSDCLGFFSSNDDPTVVGNVEPRKSYRPDSCQVACGSSACSRRWDVPDLAESGGAVRNGSHRCGWRGVTEPRPSGGDEGSW